MNILKAILKDSYILASVNSFIGLVIAIWIYKDNSSYADLIWAAPISAFLVVLFFWNKFVVDRPTLQRSIFVSVVVGVISHPIAWLLMGIGLMFRKYCYYYTGFCDPAKFNDDNTFLAVMTGPLLLSFFSLLFFGVFTVGISVITAVGLFMFRRSKQKK